MLMDTITLKWADAILHTSNCVKSYFLNVQRKCLTDIWHMFNKCFTIVYLNHLLYVYFFCDSIITEWPQIPSRKDTGGHKLPIYGVYQTLQKWPTWHNYNKRNCYCQILEDNLFFLKHYSVINYCWWRSAQITIEDSEITQHVIGYLRTDPTTIHTNLKNKNKNKNKNNFILHRI